MMNTNIHWGCHIMTTCRSFHLIVNRKLGDDCRHARDFVHVDYVCWGGVSTLLF